MLLVEDESRKVISYQGKICQPMKDTWQTWKGTLDWQRLWSSNALRGCLNEAWKR